MFIIVSDWFHAGLMFTAGCISALVIVGVVNQLVNRALNRVGRDATDPPKGERSGLVLRTDHETGVEYLITRGGGITPRLPRNTLEGHPKQ